MKRRMRGQAIDGILLLDKPIGWSSNAALQAVKRLLNARKAGHTGNLDPLATGLLPLCFGEATKVSSFLLDANKSYRFTCTLGITTRTGDAEGEVVQTRPVGLLDPDTVDAVLARFVGSIEQIPPMYSALKHNGQRLYDLARQGIEVERAPRTVTIHRLTRIHLTDHLLECELVCSKGTYVRTLAEDIGEVLGCGAHISALRRTGVTPYETDSMITLEALQAHVAQGQPLDAVLLPMDSALTHWPILSVQGDVAHYFQQGQAVVIAHAPTHGYVRLYQDRHLIGIGEIQEDGRVAPRRLLRSIV